MRMRPFGFAGDAYDNTPAFPRELQRVVEQVQQQGARAIRHLVWRPLNVIGVGSCLSEALAGDYVVQEKVQLRTEVFPIFGESGWALQPMYVDTNPFLFEGRVEGAMVRLSDSPVVNVTSGGGETGFFVIEGEARQ